MDDIRPASLADFHRLRLLLRTGRHLFADFGSEDLTSLLSDGAVLIGAGRGRADERLWGGLILQRRARSPALPDAAPNLVMLRGLALAAGRAPSSDVPQLVEAAVATFEDARPTLFKTYATQAWIVAPLQAAGFALSERLIFLELANLQRRTLPVAAWAPDITLRPAFPTDIDALAQIDAAAFAPAWHMDAEELKLLLMTGRLHLALEATDAAQRIVGYSALSLQAEDTAHVARLAVHPQAQGKGIGRLLLHDAVAYAQQSQLARVMLNTQGQNERARALYRAYGFRATGKIVPVLTLALS